MNYADDHKAGLPVSTAWMESLVKEINWRVKGTEMFWNNPAGAEAILQIRAASLSEDDRLKNPPRPSLHSPLQISQNGDRKIKKQMYTQI